MLHEFWHQDDVPIALGFAEKWVKFGRSGNGAIKDGIQSNVFKQAGAKMAECAVARHFDLDPLRAVDWRIGYPDNGHDLMLPDGRAIQVKSSDQGFRLLWPVTQNETYWDRYWTHIAAVVTDPHDLAHGWISGQFRKRKFFDKRKVSDGTDGLVPDTWHVYQVELDDIDDLKQHDLFERFCVKCGDDARFGSRLHHPDEQWWCMKHRPH